MKTFLHLGCGPIHLHSTHDWKWINIDWEASHNPDLVLNCLELHDHFGDNSVDAVYGCHTLEHYKYPDDAISLINQCHHVLKPGGILRMAVPDLELAAKAYALGDDLKFIYGPDFKGYYKHDLPAERFHFFMTAWEHKIVYDFQLLSQLMKDAGFTSVRKCYPNDTEIPGFNSDRYISESLYIEAKK